MATASKKSSTTSKPLECKYDDENYGVALTLCNNLSHGIKSSPNYWKSMDRSKSTYFILPEEPPRFDYIVRGIQAGRTNPSEADFERFWFELSDSYKERRLLANYIIAYNEIRKAVKGENADEIKSCITEIIDEVAHMVRSYSLEKNKAKFREDGLLYFINANSVEYAKWIRSVIFRRCFAAASSRIDMKCVTTDESEKILTRVPARLIHFAFGGYHISFFTWISWNIEHLQPYLPFRSMLHPQLFEGMSGRHCQDEYVRKLSLAAPRWSKSDRQFMLQAIESNGQSCRGTYVQFVLEKVGVEKFKHLVFGKHRFCAHCNRSSYISEDRLLACKRCDVEGVRPRAWYCGKECQRGDWIRHRAVMHTPVEKVLEKTKKKRKQKKKGKKGK